MQIKMTHILRNRAAWYLLKRKMSRYNCSSCIDVSSDVSIALRNHRPVVALESTIITHGMPYPQNLEVAQQVEETVRKEGAVPATIAIIGGRIKVGLDPEILADFASLNVPAIKTSRRDFPYVLSKGLNGGTTVAGTIMVANTVGIKVFATGGLGGVHRGGETTMDISTDLMELGRNSIAVVSSGIKSILDIEKTLEYLETQGVCVVTYGKNKNFPSFYTSNSGLESPYNVETPTEAAILINKLFEFRMNSGVLLAVPIPEEDAMEGSEIEEAINEALKEAKNRGIKGKEVTPFILNKVMNLTDGKSLTSNIALIKNNAKVAAQVAIELEKLQTGSLKLRTESSNSTPVSEDVFQSVQPTTEKLSSNSPLVFVVGGSVLDSVISVKETSILGNGSTHRGEIRQSGGGVGRNIADALGKLEAKPFLVSAIGKDQTGNYLLHDTLKHIDTRGVVRHDSCRTACYSAILDHNGECYFGVGDMNINDAITPELVENFLEQLHQSSLVVIDGNIPVPTIDYVLRVCRDAQIPVWFEPTDTRKAGKVFQSRYWTTLSFVSPNLNELQVMSQASGLFYSLNQFDSSEEDRIISEASFLARNLVEHIGAAIITLGRLGILVVREGEADEPMLTSRRNIPHTKSSVFVRHYQVPFNISEREIINVSGAGDCLAAGMIEAMLRGLPETECVSAGFSSASWALKSSSAVPLQIPVSDRPLRAEYTHIYS